MRLHPGTLSTTLHKTQIGDSDTPYALNCDTGRGIWEIDQRYRQVNVKPSHASGTPSEGGTGMAIMRWDGNDRTLFAVGDSLFASPTTGYGSLSGGSDHTLDVDWVSPALHGEDQAIWQDGQYAYVANPVSVRRVNLDDLTVADLEQMYDSSLYEGLWAVESNWAKVEWENPTKATPGGDTIGEPTDNGSANSVPDRFKPIDGSHADVTGTNFNFSSDGGIVIHDNFTPNPQQVARWRIRVDFNTAKDWSAQDYLIVPISRQTPSDDDGDDWIEGIARRAVQRQAASSGSLDLARLDNMSGWIGFNNRNRSNSGFSTAFLGYDKDPATASKAVNHRHRGGFLAYVRLHEGANTAASSAVFLNPSGKTLYLCVSLISGWGSVDLSAVDGIEFDVWCHASDSYMQSFAIPNLYTYGSFLPHDDAAAAATDRGLLTDSSRIAAGETELLGYGPVTSGLYLDYAYRYKVGSTYSDPVLVRIPMSEFYGDAFEIGGFATPTKATITPPVGDAAYTHIEIYRKKLDTEVFRLLTTVANSGTPSYTDTVRDDELTGTALGQDVPAPLATGVVAGCSHNGSNVMALETGEITMSEVGAPLNFLMPGFADFPYTEEDDGRPRMATVTSKGDPALQLVSNGALYVFTRRAVYAKGGAFPSDGHFVKIASRGSLGPRAACDIDASVVYASDSGLFSVRVHPNFESVSGNLPEPQELTINLEGTWNWLMGDSPEGTVVAYHDREIWVFNDSRYLRYTRQGRWNHGEWANGKLVVAAAGDPESGLLLQFSDGTVGLVGDYLTDGGTNLAGDNGTAPAWSYKTKRWTEDISVGRASLDMETDATNGKPTVDLTIRTSRNEVGATVEFRDLDQPSLAFPRDGDPLNGTWFEFEMSGAAADRVLSVDVQDVAQAHDRRGPR